MAASEGPGPLTRPRIEARGFRHFTRNDTMHHELRIHFGSNETVDFRGTMAEAEHVASLLRDKRGLAAEIRNREGTLLMRLPAPGDTPHRNILSDFDADEVRDIIIEMTNAAHVDIHNSNAAYTLDEDGVYGWDWLNDSQLAELIARLSAPRGRTAPPAAMQGE